MRSELLRSSVTAVCFHWTTTSSFPSEGKYFHFFEATTRPAVRPRSPQNTVEKINARTGAPLWSTKCASKDLISGSSPTREKEATERRGTAGTGGEKNKIIISAVIHTSRQFFACRPRISSQRKLEAGDTTSTRFDLYYPTTKEGTATTTSATGTTSNYSIVNLHSKA